MATWVKGKCPRCGNELEVDTVRYEKCRCGYSVYYGDAHATGEAQISKIENPPVPKGEENG